MANQARVPNPRERVFDAKVAPLMEQVLEVCERAGIPLLVVFEMDAGGGPVPPRWRVSVGGGGQSDPDAISPRLQRLTHAALVPEPRKSTDQGKTPAACIYCRTPAGVFCECGGNA